MAMVDDATQIAFAPIKVWCRIAGIGPTKTYEEAQRGNIRIIKVGKRSLVDVPHGLKWLRSLPAAQIRRAPPRKAEAPAPDIRKSPRRKTSAAAAA